MKPSQALTLIAYASQIDPTLNPRQPEDRVLKAQVWADTLNPNMTPSQALDAIRQHYKQPFPDQLTPGIINDIHSRNQNPDHYAPSSSHDFKLFQERMKTPQELNLITL